MQDIRYVGFWARTAAAVLDSLFLLVALVPLVFLLNLIAGGDGADPQGGLFQALIVNGFPILAVLVFWWAYQATPGKMLVKARIVDAETLGEPENWQWVVRYLGYTLSTIPFFAGLIWVGIDERKQGWHDKLARTVVVRAD